MSKLWSPLSIKEITLKNRIVISPMCQYSCIDGFGTDWHLVHLGSRAIGGAGLIIQEATAVSPEGRISPGDAGIYKDEHQEKWGQIATFIQQHGAVAGIQLAHAGRKASCQVPWQGGKQIPVSQGGWKTLAPSAIAYRNEDEAPLEMSAVDIKKAIADFRSAAFRALQTGYRVIEIHAAHGYLIDEFLSPLSNKRTDEYGGSFENRIRFLLEIVTAIQREWPAHYPLLVRISATDWAEGGWTEIESIQLSGILKQNGVDLIDCSSGGLVQHAKIPVGPGYQVSFAEHIRKETGILTGAVGLITEPQQAEEILQNGRADLIVIARASLRDPYFPIHAAYTLGDDITWPSQYARAKI